ncbi:MAG: butyrate kinase [Bacteroidales bacterium]|nr:butyrate kinase [Bacteroidales bacterium]
MKTYKILVINPGSTSTKVAVFVDDKEIFKKNIKHTMEELAPYKTLYDQYPFRKEVILRELKEAGININDIDVVIGRGGLMRPIPSGVYEVNEKMINDLKVGVLGQHASNLGGVLANDIAKNIGVKAFIADPVVVDEMEDVARYTGHPLFERISIFHALNQKAIARLHANSIGKKYEELNLIVAHLGGGISVGAHYKGRVIDVNNALDGEGPFSPERSGTLPAGALVRLCFSGKYSQEEILNMITGKGGYVAYLNTNDAYEVEQRIKNGDEKAAKVREAMAYQVSKAIGEMATVLKGKVDAILITGGIAYDNDFVEYIKERTSFIAPIFVYPGEDEMRALATNALMAMRGEVEIKQY